MIDGLIWSGIGFFIVASGVAKVLTWTIATFPFPVIAAAIIVVGVVGAITSEVIDHMEEQHGVPLW